MNLISKRKKYKSKIIHINKLKKNEQDKKSALLAHINSKISSQDNIHNIKLQKVVHFMMKGQEI